MRYIYLNLLLILFLNSQLSFGQQMPIDFSDASENFSVWGGSIFSKTQSPTDFNNTVGEFFHSASTDEQGFYLDLSRVIDLDFQKTITLSFYAFDQNIHTVGLKLERGTNPDVQVTVNTTSSQNNWISLTFDFSNAVYSSDFTSVNASGTYTRLTVLIDQGIANSKTFLIDDIDDGSTPVVSPPDPVYDYLVWSDEFNGTGAINTSNWFHQTIGPNGGVWYNEEQQNYTDRTENSYLQNGFLNIVAKKENYQPPGGVLLPYTSARLNSKFAFTYGKVEVRAKLPSGVGTWPAIWTLGKNITETGAYWETQEFGTTSWPACGEIDIMEHWGTDQNYVQSAMHTPSSYGGTVNLGGQLIPTASTAFHDYVLEWYPDKMVFSVDGNVHYTYQPAIRDSNTWPFFTDQYLLLNLAIQSSIEPSYTQSAMVVDYVRIYQTNPLSIDDNILNDIKVYPNPANTKINISSQLNIDKVDLYDITGKLILTTNKPKSNVIDVSAITNGMYLLKIYSGERSSTKKIVIN